MFNVTRIAGLLWSKGRGPFTVDFSVAGRNRLFDRRQRREQSTLLKTLSGPVAPDAGTVSFRGSGSTGVRPRRGGLGLAHVPEGRRIFPRLTVLENLEIGRSSVRISGASSVLGPGGGFSPVLGQGSARPAERSQAANSKCSPLAGH